jgi:hypothetical protein
MVTVTMAKIRQTPGYNPDKKLLIKFSHFILQARLFYNKGKNVYYAETAQLTKKRV